MDRTSKAVIVVVAIAAGGTFGSVSILGGCAKSSKARPLRASDFVVQSPDPHPNAHGPVDQAPPAMYNNVALDLMRPAEEGDEIATPVNEVSQVVQQTVKSPHQEVAEEAKRTPATRASSATTRVAATRVAAAPVPAPLNPPTTTPAASTGQYMTMGGVVAEVNAAPIYANKVLSIIEPDLAAKARQMDIKTFQAYANDQITKAVRFLVRDELEYANALHRLDEKDRLLAENLTTQWRNRQITEAGGSIELARQKFEADGQDFDEALKQQNRLHMTQVYYQKKLVPRIQITAADMRAYYQLNKDKEFTEHAEATFRLIKIDPKIIGGSDPKAQALAKAKELRERAMNGEDFAELAAFGHDQRLAKNGGLDTAQKGAYVLEKVEVAIWESREPGQITDVIEESKSFYIAKLESRKAGRTLPFESEQVQSKIREELRSRQFRALREASQADLEKTAIINFQPKMQDVALEMAMQRYSQWASVN